MMKRYSHVRRKALDAAAAVLEPVVIEEKAIEEVSDEEVTSQVTSQSADVTREAVEIAKKVGSPHWTISATGSSEKLRKSAFFRQIRQGFANHAGGLVDAWRLLVIYPSNSLSDRSFVGDWEPAARAESVGVEDGTACVPRGRDERSP